MQKAQHRIPGFHQLSRDKRRRDELRLGVIHSSKSGAGDTAHVDPGPAHDAHWLALGWLDQPAAPF